jgi:hypothetical protein
MSRRTTNPDGTVEVTLQASGGRPLNVRHASELSRALLKIGLEAVWRGFGEEALYPYWDHVRAAVLGAPRDGYIAVATKVDTKTVDTKVTYPPFLWGQDERGMFAGINFAGVVIFTDSRRDNPEGIDIGAEFDFRTFTASS